MSYAYQFILEAIAADLEAVYGPGAVESLMTRPRDVAVTTLCEYAEFFGEWDDSAMEIEDDITIRAHELGIGLTQVELRLLLALAENTKDLRA